MCAHSATPVNKTFKMSYKQNLFLLIQEVSNFCAGYSRCCLYPCLISLTPLLPSSWYPWAGLSALGYWQKTEGNIISESDIWRLEASANTDFCFPKRHRQLSQFVFCFLSGLQCAEAVPLAQLYSPLCLRGCFMALSCCVQ